jgi:hypothetical protein
MSEQKIIAPLRGAVIGWALMGLLGIPLAVYFDLFEGWRWQPYNAIYDQMIVSIYFAVGICSAMAIKNPMIHTSFLGLAIPLWRLRKYQD